MQEERLLIQEKPRNLSGGEVLEVMGMTPEQVKYLKCWSVEDYRKVSPGERCVDMFLEVVGELNPETEKQTLIDFGCGTGRAAKKLDDYFNVTPMDFAVNCLDDDVQEHFGERFVEHDLTQKTALRADWGYCTDVMEHLPPEDIDKALETMFEACDNVFFQIATIPDHFGGHPDIKEHLHLSVFDYDWWLNKFAEHGCIVHRSKEERFHVIFMVSGYQGFAFDKMKMNTTPDIIFQQMRANLGHGLKMLCPFQEQQQKVIVLGGGPSLNDYVDEIKEHKKNGAKIITLNGSYQWAKEHDLWPVNQFMIDAREFNKRFVDPVDEQNTYIIATQCHPELINKLPAEKTWLFQANLDPGSVDICNEVLGEMYKDWFPVPGGSTVMLRCLPALQMMGFRDVEIYGFDSCLMNNEHHAFEQPENDTDDDKIAWVSVEGRRFAIEPWMLSQAKEFIEFRERLLRELIIKVHGDGLIAHCLAKDLHILEEEDGSRRMENQSECQV